ncbi:Glycosyltransferase involved in cell wall bisynthesis [Humidesulfovibrio mexicanus]|uniref:Glycosyltransferase involved in cell wall bisynthesis n=1 Tax=Humidesulfovibrio mexicanus TaxID=147047 RepID=A0A239BWI2_9BACT|nr:glycosyltransferase family 2 protein [Humidesulfovibrio mexicanus]SNS11414.1 Glycosyltransferase involved in cell wall bisynthesis [Humidesulfovibrio mexicanus]
MSNAPKVSVYIAARNCAKYLEAAIESVLRQSMSGWELLIFDDNSTDRTQAVLDLYRGVPGVRLFRTEGVGLPGVCNLASAEARGEYLIRLDGDDVFEENILLVLANHLDANPDVALVFPDYYLIDEQGDFISLSRTPRLFERNHATDLPPNGACTMIRRRILQECGGYREDLGAQDGFDLWTKLKGSHKSANVNLPLFYYRRHGSNLTNDHGRIFHARREIKREMAQEAMRGQGPFLAVIPCRRHFDFLPDLWNERINGHTLLDLAILACAGSPLYDTIIVSCDNPEAEDTVRRHADPRLRFHLRDPKDTIRSRSVAHTLETVARLHDPELSGVTTLNYIHTPFVTTQTLEESVFTLALNGADSSYGVEKVISPVFKRNAHGFEMLNPRREFASDFDSVYLESCAFVTSRSRLFATGALSGPLVVNFLMPGDESFIINSRRALDMARVIYKDRKDGAA